MCTKGVGSRPQREEQACLRIASTKPAGRKGLRPEAVIIHKTIPRHNEAVPIGPGDREGVLEAEPIRGRLYLPGRR